MLRRKVWCAAAIAAMLLPGAVQAAPSIEGIYLEARTCQVYTGPCFANAEVGLTGKDAIMAWSVQRGAHGGVDISGLSVVVVVNGNQTLGHQGLADPDQLRSVILVDERAGETQREALVAFARQQIGAAGDSIARIDAAPIQMSLDLGQLRGELAAGTEVKLATRKAREDDCICSNETAFYPPLAELTSFVPGVSVESQFTGRGLGSRWSMPDARNAYLGTFSF